ncbi:hypothetical protein HYV64_01720 [Candidatus Shapirobacteria bacterium]|nr:hypothetical protein [Candidatus Shapirobacteria bacterium]
MNSGPFWLANISSESLTVSLITFEQSYRVSSTGPEIPFELSPRHFSEAVDQSLSAAAESANLDPDQEPDTIALVIPPSWIGIDGKILSDKLKLFEELFREMKLRPMGFISYDDAIAEANNQIEGYLSSFVLVNFQREEMYVSLIYLGKVIERIGKTIVGEFGSVLLENALLELKTESTLPPQIIITGSYNDNILSSIKAHAWVGRKDVETFLHFPDIKSHSPAELTSIFLQAVSSQFDNSPSSTPRPKVEPEVEATVPVGETEIIEPEEVIVSEEVANSEPYGDADLVEVDPEDIGFAPMDDNFSPVVDSPQAVIPPELEAVPMTSNIPIATTKPKIKINFPKIKFSAPALPKLQSKTLLILLMFSPLLVLIPFFYSKAEITLFLTPYNFQKTITATFDPTVTEVDLGKGVFPSLSSVKELTTSVTVPTTGQKTIGDRSTGEIVIYNKSDKPLNLSKGSILSDQGAHKFELETAIQVASSSSNFALGVINLGQTKAMIKAADIGPEFNIEKDVMLTFKDNPETTVIAKVNSTLGGGNRRQIRAVSGADKTSLDSRLASAIDATTDKYLQSSISKIPNSIPELTQTKKGRVEYNREIGEEADELVATVTTTITTFSLNDTHKSKIINALFATDPDFGNVVSNYDQFSLTIQSKNQATFAVRYLPKIDKTSIAKMISGKSQKTATSLIKKNVRRVYNYQIATNLKAISFFNPLPLRTENIIINIK